MNGVETIPAGPRGPKRIRRVYTLKADEAIWKAVADYQFITAELIADIVDRDYGVMRNRLFALYSAGYLNRQQRDQLSPFVYFFDEKGAKEAARLGYLPEVRFITGKSRLLINHDLEITLFHRELEKAFGHDLSQWEQWRGDLKDQIDGEALIPDARFVLHDKFFFLEIVKSYESEYEHGISNVERKFELYNSYRNQFREKYGHEDFRVLWVLPTQARVAGLLGKVEERFPYRRFYVTDEQSYKTKIKENIWWTPKDFETATYRLI